MKQILQKMNTQEWNKIFLNDLNTFTEEEFTLLGNLAVYLKRKYDKYMQSPRTYNKALK